mmetsp:Transcript_6341/g.12519  ORF Transcript_6341/g.12519 Transcript_6341/m.12519 type:complete len:2301 (-) Transcript_6341:30-6932(-)
MGDRLLMISLLLLALCHVALGSKFGRCQAGTDDCLHYKTRRSLCQYCGDGESCPRGYPRNSGSTSYCWGLKVNVQCYSCAPGYYDTGSGSKRYCASCDKGKSSGESSSKCNPCGVGMYNDESAGSCRVCPDGTYADEAGTETCSGCHGYLLSSWARWYSNSAVGHMACTMCASYGHVANANGDDCEQCPDGKIVNSEPLDASFARISREDLLSLKDRCKTCVGGKFSNYATTNAMSCDECPPGTFSTEGAGTCTTCPAGRWSGSGQAQECNECDAGKTSQAGAVACIDCRAGKYSEGPTDAKPSSPCEFCPVGKISSSRASDCDSCSSGKSSFGVDSTGQEVTDVASMHTGPTSCISCDAGKYSNALTEMVCVNCEAGKYSEFGSNMCDRCDWGKYSGSGQPVCTDCEPGKYNHKMAQANCTLCEIAKYQNDAGKTSCDVCEKGKVTNTTTPSDLGAESCKDCPVQTYKNNKCANLDGSYEASQTCEDTDEGQTSLNSCLACPSNMYAGVGSEICQGCPAGTKSLEVSGVTECRACPPGTRSGIKDDECTACPVGEFSNANVDTSINYASSSSNVLPEEVNDSCEKCPAGRHTSTPEIQKISTTKTGTSDIGGQFTFTYTAADASQVGPITVNFDSKALDVQTSFVGATTKLEDGDILVKRVECADPKGGCTWELYFDGVFGDVGTVTLDDASLDNGSAEVTISQEGIAGTGSSGCSDCERGKYKSLTGSFCKACAPGKRGGVPPAPDHCVKCTPGKFAESGALTCELCPSGRYSNLESVAECELCSPGKRRSNNGGTTIDTIENNGAACSLCTAGKYYASEGLAATECTSCAPGSYESGLGSIGCEPCSAGKYAAASGAIACDFCNEGDKEGMISKRGKSDCEPCPAGTVSGPIPGITYCIACSGGMYQNLAGKRTCEFCLSGMYQPDPEDVKPYNLTGPPPAPPVTVYPTAAPTTPSPTSASSPTSAPTVTNSTASPTPSPTTSPATPSPTAAPTVDITLSPTVFSEDVYIYGGIMGATQCRTCKPGTWSKIRGDPSDLISSGNAVVGQTECSMCPLGRYSNVWGTRPRSVNQDGDTVVGYPNPNSLTSGCIKCAAGKIGVANRTMCDICSAPLKDKKVYSSYSAEESDACYNLATEDQMFSCPQSTHPTKRSDCSWFFIDKWEDNIGEEERAKNRLDNPNQASHNEGTENPFGYSCESFSLCEADPTDEDKDIYKMMCDKCSPGYMSAGRLQEIQTITTSGTGMSGQFEVTYVSSDGVSRQAVQVSHDAPASTFGAALSSSISSSLVDGDISVKKLACTDPTTGCQWEVHFVGIYGDVAMLSVADGTLSGGTVSVAETQTGSDGPIDGTTTAGLSTNCAGKRFQSYCYRPTTLDFCPSSTVCEYWSGGKDDTSYVDNRDQNSTKKSESNISPFYTNEVNGNDKYPPVATSCAEYRVCGFELDNSAANAAFEVAEAALPAMHKLNIACTQCSQGFVSIAGDEKQFAANSDASKFCPGKLPTTCMMLDGKFTQGQCPLNKLSLNRRRQLLLKKREERRKAKEEFENAVTGLRGTARSLFDTSCACSCTGESEGLKIPCVLSNQCEDDRTVELGCSPAHCICRETPTIPDEPDASDAEVQCKFLYSQYEIDDDDNTIEWETDWERKYSGSYSPFKPTNGDDTCKNYVLCMFDAKEISIPGVSSVHVQDEYYLLCGACNEDQNYFPAIDPDDGATMQYDEDEKWTCTSSQPSPTYCYLLTPAKYEAHFKSATHNCNDINFNPTQTNDCFYWASSNSLGTSASWISKNDAPYYDKSCKEYDVCYFDKADFKRDKFYMQCNECADGYEAVYGSHTSETGVAIPSTCTSPTHAPSDMLISYCKKLPAPTNAPVPAPPPVTSAPTLAPTPTPDKGTVSKVVLTIELQFIINKVLSEKEKDNLEMSMERTVRDIMEARSRRYLTANGVKFGHITVRAFVTDVMYPIAKTAIVSFLVEVRSQEDNDGVAVNEITNEVVSSSNDNRLSTTLKSNAKEGIPELNRVSTSSSDATLAETGGIINVVNSLSLETTVGAFSGIVVVLLIIAFVVMKKIRDSREEERKSWDPSRSSEFEVGNPMKKMKKKKKKKKKDAWESSSEDEIEMREKKRNAKAAPPPPPPPPPPPQPTVVVKKDGKKKQQKDAPPPPPPAQPEKKEKKLEKEKKKDKVKSSSDNPDDHWTTKKDPKSGETFFYNRLTKAVSWTDPMSKKAAPPPPPVPPAPAADMGGGGGWGAVKDNVVTGGTAASQQWDKVVESLWDKIYDEASGYYYYQHKTTGESTWDQPADYVE